MAVHGAEQQRVVHLQQGGRGAGAEGRRPVRLHDGEHRGGLRRGEAVRAHPGWGAPGQQGIRHRTAAK